MTSTNTNTEYDFIVIGTGIAGLSFALQACKHGKVAVFTKREALTSNTAWAQGGIACVTAGDDTFASHLADTLDAGAGLCDESVVRTIVTEGPDRIRDLVNLGVAFDANADGTANLGREGGHSERRVLHSGDTTGREIATKLLEAAMDESSISIYEHHFVVDLITTGKLGLASEDRVIGLYVLDCKSGIVETFRSDRVVLSTGGCGRVSLYITNPNVATGDGVAMAWRAGAVISNMEFIQFHPTCLYHPEVKNFLITEALRGEGAVLIGADGKSFMEKYDTRESLAPRDIVARAIDREIKKTGSQCVYLDVTHQSREFLEERFPNIYATCAKLGIDIASEPIPVVPAAHYQCGGVKTNINGATSIRGLYAIGEVACTGLHGANRLASNSLLEGVVLAKRACDHVLGRMPIEKADRESLVLPQWESGDVQDVDELVVIYHNWDEIRRLMWDYVSIVRTSKRLQRAATRLGNLKHEVQEFYWNFKITTDLLELRNLVDTAALIVDAAASRKESRGAHYTLDYPEPDTTSEPVSSLMRRY